MPSALPVLQTMSSTREFYRQDFVDQDLITGEVGVGNRFFNETEQPILIELFQNYTQAFVGNPLLHPRIDTVCAINKQNGEGADNNQTHLSVDYSCSWMSDVIDVGPFPELFRAEVNSGLVGLTTNLQRRGMTWLRESLDVKKRVVLSPAPSVSISPSGAPSSAPSVSMMPSAYPTAAPSAKPTPLATAPPGLFNPTPQTEVEDKQSASAPVAAIISIVVFIGIVALVGLFFYHRSWKKSRDQRSYLPQVGARPDLAPNGAYPESPSMLDDRTDRNVLLSPAESLVSTKSLISPGGSRADDESADEVDGTKNLQDEFDQFKDQNLEQLREDVEGNLRGFEGNMSVAVTNALMGDEERNVETSDLLWGCAPDPEGSEIEASALFEVYDWLKRNENASSEQKRAFMQEILNKMVTSVRYGVMGAKDASRTIHESAAILGLQLAEELPMTTVIISGMRKTTNKKHMMDALGEFGDIDSAAMASGMRGFGIVRFRRPKSVDRALSQYRKREIVILDVSIQMKVLMPSGDLDGR